MIVSEKELCKSNEADSSSLVRHRKAIIALLVIAAVLIAALAGAWAMFGGWAYTILFCMGFLLLPGWKLGFAGYMGAFIGLNLVLCGVLYLWLKKRGCGVFAAL